MVQPIKDPEFHKRLAELGYCIKDGVVTELGLKEGLVGTKYHDDDLYDRLLIREDRPE